MKHEMEMTRQYSSGAQEWSCPSCGRHVVRQHHPQFKQIVLSAGDQEAGHAGSTVGWLQVGGTSVVPVKNNGLDLWRDAVPNDVLG